MDIGKSVAWLAFLAVLAALPMREARQSESAALTLAQPAAAAVRTHGASRACQPHGASDRADPADALSPAGKPVMDACAEVAEGLGG